jgi:hypothetical protein
MPNMIAAQAFPFACSAPGRVSTRRARSTACTNRLVRSSTRKHMRPNKWVSPALMLKSMQYIDKTASQTVRTLFCETSSKCPELGCQKESDRYSRRSPCCDDRGEVSSESEENECHRAEGYTHSDVRSPPAKARLGVVSHDTCAATIS